MKLCILYLWLCWKQKTHIHFAFKSYRQVNTFYMWHTLPPRGYSGFQVTGIIVLGHESKPKKSVDQKLTPKKSHAEFPSLKNFQKTLNDITCLFYLVVLHPQNYAARIHWHYHKSSDCFKNQKNPYLNQATPKKYLPNFPTQKSPSIRYPRLLKSRVPPGPSHMGTSQYMWKPRDTVVYFEWKKYTYCKVVVSGW